MVRADRGPEDFLLHGVVAQDGSRAVFGAVQLTQSITSDQGRVRLPGLDATRTYRVTKVQTPGAQPRNNAPWWVDGGHVELNGAALANVGVQVPAQWPENAILLDVQAID